MSCYKQNAVKKKLQAKTSRKERLQSKWSKKSILWRCIVALMCVCRRNTLIKYTIFSTILVVVDWLLSTGFLLSTFF